MERYNFKDKSSVERHGRGIRIDVEFRVRLEKNYVVDYWLCHKAGTRSNNNDSKLQNGKDWNRGGNCRRIVTM